MLADRSVFVDHMTVSGSTHRYAPEIEKRLRLPSSSYEWLIAGG